MVVIVDEVVGICWVSGLGDDSYCTHFCMKLYRTVGYCWRSNEVVQQGCVFSVCFSCRKLEEICSFAYQNHTFSSNRKLYDFVWISLQENVGRWRKISSRNLWIILIVKGFVWRKSDDGGACKVDMVPWNSKWLCNEMSCL